MSLLTVVQSVTRLLSLPVPTVVATSTDKQVQQLFELANEEGADLASSFDWQALTMEDHFTSVAADAQPAAIPADWDRFLPNSFFNRTTRRPITGPITPRQWQWIKAQPVYSTVYLAFRERNNTFLIAPVPPAGQDIYYEYVSKNWAKSAGGTPQSQYILDTDTSYLDETLIALGLRWRYLSAKGLDYTEAMESAERNREQTQARDGGSSMLTMAPQPINPNRANLPDGNFGV